MQAEPFTCNRSTPLERSIAITVEHGMNLPLLLLGCLLVVSFDVRAATDNPAPRRNYQKQLDEENLLFLRELQKLIEQRGYRHVRVVPQLFVAKAEDSDGKERTLIVNSDTLEAYAFEGRLPLGDKPSETKLPALH